MPTPTERASHLMNQIYRDQHARLEPKYQSASAQITKRWDVLRRTFAGTYDALLAKSQDPAFGRDQVHQSREYAEFRREVNDALLQFTETVSAVVASLEADGKTQGIAHAYRALELSGERPQRVDNPLVVTKSTQSAINKIPAEVIARMDDKWQQAEQRGYSAQWAIKQMRDVVKSLPVAIALGLGHTAQVNASRAASLAIYEAQQYA